MCQLVEGNFFGNQSISQVKQGFLVIHAKTTKFLKLLQFFFIPKIFTFWSAEMPPYDTLIKIRIISLSYNSKTNFRVFTLLLYVTKSMNGGMMWLQGTLRAHVGECR